MNNLDKINLFLDDRNNTSIVLPKVSAEVVIFYQLLILEILKSKNFLCKKIENYKNINELIAPSLFEEKSAYIIDIGLTKSILEDLSGVQDKSQKFFIFVKCFFRNPQMTRDIIHRYTADTELHKNISCTLKKIYLFRIHATKISNFST